MTRLSIAEVSTKFTTTVNESLSQATEGALPAPAARRYPYRAACRDSDLHGTKNAVEDAGELEALGCRVGALPTATEVRTIGPTKACRIDEI